MGYQSTFKRYEMKYIITKQEKEKCLLAISDFMAPDEYGQVTIRNIYYDTPTYRLIRRSIEKPVYKEKLRIRSYSQAAPEDPVFVELKKKYQHIVYKRRISLPQNQVMDSMEPERAFSGDSQIVSEINTFKNYYKNLRPAVFLTYDRTAYYSLNDGNFRITFDENIKARNYDISLEKEPGGELLLDENLSLMEIKTAGGIPMELCNFFTENHIYKTSFSKYGAAYLNLILPNMKGAV